MEGSQQTAVLVDAKRMYTSQLCDALYPSIMTIFQNMYDGCAKQKKPLVVFMTRLKESPMWNNGIIKNYTDIMLTKCPWLSELLAAVFVSHVKVLTSVRLGSNKPHIRLKIPSNETYVHAVLVDVAQELYSNPYLIQQQDLKAKGAKRELICKCVDSNVRKLLPLRDILNAYMGTTVNNNEFQPEAAAEEAESSQHDSEPAEEPAEEPVEDDDVPDAADDPPAPHPAQPPLAAPYNEAPTTYDANPTPTTHDTNPAPTPPSNPVSTPNPPHAQPSTTTSSTPWQPHGPVVQERAPVDDEHRTVPLPPAKHSAPQLYDDAADELE